MSIPRRWWWIHLALLAGAGVLLLVLGRHQWFFGDEWEFFTNRGLGPGATLSIWRPHNEHWSTLPIIVMTGLRDVVGLSSYWPYLIALLLCHLALAHVLWRICVRAGAAPLFATIGAAVFSLLGAGAENLLWAFQIGFVGALLLGWLAILVGDHPQRLSWRDTGPVVLLVGALMCSGVGVPMVASAAVAVLLRSRSWVRALAVGGIPGVVFAIWYRLIGTVNGSPPMPARSWTEKAHELGSGIISQATAVTGGPVRLVELALLVLGVCALVVGLWAVRGTDRGRLAAAPLGGLVGAVVFAVLTAVGRSDLTASRYVYVVVALALPMAMVVLSLAPSKPWIAGTIAVLMVAVGAHNVALLVDRARAEAAREASSRALVESAAELAVEGGEHLLDQPDPYLNPDLTVEALRRLVDDGLGTSSTAVGTATALRNLDVAVGPQVPEGISVTPATDVRSTDVIPAGTGTGETCWTAWRGVTSARVTAPSTGRPIAFRFDTAVATSVDVVVSMDGVQSEVRHFALPAGVPLFVTADLPVAAELVLNVPPAAAHLCEVG